MRRGGIEPPYSLHEVLRVFHWVSLIDEVLRVVDDDQPGVGEQPVDRCRPLLHRLVINKHHVPLLSRPNAGPLRSRPLALGTLDISRHFSILPAKVDLDVFFNDLSELREAYCLSILLPVLRSTVSGLQTLPLYFLPPLSLTPEGVLHGLGDVLH